MRVIAENMANANSTARTPGGDPYRRQVPVFKPTQVAGGEGVVMAKVDPDQRDFKPNTIPATRAPTPRAM
jgi:flagellar basal-body rod protein FlgC